MPKPQAPKANIDPAPQADTAPQPSRRDELLERIKAANPHSRVYRNQFGSIVTEHKVKR